MIKIASANVTIAAMKTAAHLTSRNALCPAVMTYVPPGPRVPLDLMEALPDPRAPRGYKETLARPGLRARPDPREIKATLVHRAPRAPPMDPLESEATLETRDPLEIKVTPAHRGPPETRVRPEIRDPLERLASASPDLRASWEIRDRKVYKDPQAPRQA